MYRFPQPANCFAEEMKSRQ